MSVINSILQQPRDDLLHQVFGPSCRIVALIVNLAVADVGKKRLFLVLEQGNVDQLLHLSVVGVRDLFQLVQRLDLAEEADVEEQPLVARIYLQLALKEGQVVEVVGLLLKLQRAVLQRRLVVLVDLREHAVAVLLELRGEILQDAVRLRDEGDHEHCGLLREDHLPERGRLDEDRLRSDDVEVALEQLLEDALVVEIRCVVDASEAWKHLVLDVRAVVDGAPVVGQLDVVELLHVFIGCLLL